MTVLKTYTPALVLSLALETFIIFFFPLLLLPHLYLKLTPSLTSPFGKKIWKLPIPQKTKVFIWKLLLNRLPTLDNISTKTSNNISITCVLCNKEPESLTHLFYHCDIHKDIFASHPVWRRIPDIKSFIYGITYWLNKDWRHNDYYLNIIINVCTHL